MGSQWNGDGSLEDRERGAEIALVGRMLSHPIRLGVIRVLRNGEPLSPHGFSWPRDLPLGSVAYHFRTLDKAGVLEVASEVKRRGAVEHFHVLRGPLVPAVLVTLDALDGKLKPAGDDDAETPTDGIELDRAVVNSTGAGDA